MNFRVLILDPIPQNRVVLWEAVSAEPHFRKVVAAKSIDEARSILSQGGEFDLILISSVIEKELLKEFMEETRRSPGSKEAAFVSVVRALEQDADKMAAALVEGTDGLLLSPFSVHALGEIAAIAARVRLEHEKKRRDAAVRLILSDVIRDVDILAKLFIDEESPARSKRKITALMQMIKDRCGDDKEALTALIAECFRDAPPVRTFTYKGASKRVAKKLAEANR